MKKAKSPAPKTTSKPEPALAGASVPVPPVADGWRRHPLPVFAVAGFVGALVDCLPCRTLSGAVRDVLVLEVRDGTPDAVELGTRRAVKLRAGELAYVDAPELLALGTVARAPAAVGLSSDHTLLVRLHEAGGYFVADIANEPVPRRQF